jgi:hypothetical protein
VNETESVLQGNRRRFRYSVRALMAMIVAVAVILALFLPLYRFGLPPCRTTVVETVTWLLAKPATASCIDCHDRVGSRLQEQQVNAAREAFRGIVREQADLGGF